MHFQIVGLSDHVLIKGSSRITKTHDHPAFEVYEAEHPLVGRLFVSVDAISGSAAIASDKPLGRGHATGDQR